MSAKLGLTLTRLCAAPGFWIEPPVSSARPTTAKLAETAVAVPLELAPGQIERSTALKVGPSQLELARAPSWLKAGILVLPRITAPAAFNRATTGASRSGNRSMPPVPLKSPDQPPVEGKPTMSMASLTTTGTPASGPSASPAARRRSIALASSSALGFMKVKAL